MRQLKNKVVLVTGGSRGIGAEIARAFSRQGSRIAIAARSEDELEQARTDLAAQGATVEAVPADVGYLDSLRRLVAEVERRLGPVDVLVNNAGTETILAFDDLSLDDIERTLRVNVTGLAWLTHLVLPSMIERGSGHIVNVASTAGIVGVAFNAVYSASKHAVVGLSRSLRAELVDKGIGVSVVCPGFVEGERVARNFEGRRPPRQVGMVTQERVAKAVLDAVLEDRGEIIIDKGLGRIADWSQAMAPEFTAKMTRRLGVVEFFRKQARANADRVTD